MTTKRLLTTTLTIVGANNEKLSKFIARAKNLFKQKAWAKKKERAKHDLIDCPEYQDDDGLPTNIIEWFAYEYP